jgi:very-short-patch-repair endonuclease
MTRKKSQSEYKLTHPQILLGIHLDELGLEFRREEKFCERAWRLDIVIPHEMIAVEISGGNWSGGHRRGEAQEDEYNKLNEAQQRGWKVFQFTNAQVNCGWAKAYIAECLGLEVHK